MPDMSPNKNPMPVQPPLERCDNYDEVALGYSQVQAVAEAGRCLNCAHKPCVQGCPVAIDIPAFIAEIQKGDPEAAYQVIARSSSLPAVCGRVCPQETQCEKVCVRGIKHEPVGIGYLERFAADWHFAHSGVAPETKPRNGKKAAVIGAGPAGLTCAGELARRGYAVTVFEALHLPGGVLVYGIPEFRLPKAIVTREIEALKALGVEIKTNMVIGRTFTVDDLFAQGYGAIFIGSGAGLPNFMNIPGENLIGVYSANEFLTRVNLMKAYRADSQTPLRDMRRVAVVGGGNVAIDAARCALRLGAEEVAIVYRRSMAELPARAEEVEHAVEEGVRFYLCTAPTAILEGEKGTVGALQCVEMDLGEPDASGRRRPIEKPDSAFTLPVDSVIMAIGTSPNPLIGSTTDALETQPWGGITVDETGATSRPGIFAGGDIVTGAATVILAMGAGRKAAEAMDQYLSKMDVQPNE